MTCLNPLFRKRSNVVLNVEPRKRIYQADIIMIRHIADGLTTKEIAVKMKYNEGTIESARLSLMRKLGVKNAAELIAYCFRNGLIN